MHRGLARSAGLASNATVEPMIDSVLAALGLLVCAGLLLRFALPPSRRHRLDSSLRRAWEGLRRLPQRLGREHKVQRQVQREADEVISRARRKAKETPAVDRRGNVYRPDAFKSRPPTDKLH